MNKNLLATVLLCIAGIQLFAQTPFNTIDSINVNNINAAVLVHGDMWWNPETEVPHCNFPNGTQKNLSLASALWMSGYDDSGHLHIAAQTFRQIGNDYWPGPLDSSDTLTYATSQQWAKIWKIYRTHVNYFLSLATHDSANTPPLILTWPGNGNTFARGNTGLPLTYYTGHTYAPFVDLNGNGIYEPLLGEYPDFTGEEALWWVFSDNGPTHTETNGKPLDVEIQAMTYAYSRGTLIDNVIYYKYKIFNRSANTYHNFRLGQFADPMLTTDFGKHIGYDTTYRMGIVYQATDCDGCAAGNPPTRYGYQLPVYALTMIALPGDSAPSYVPAGSFDYFNNDPSGNGNPGNDVEYDNYLRAKIKLGIHLSDDFTGPGMPSKAYGSGPDCNYVYTGDPGVSDQWSECACNNPVGDKRYVLASNDFTLAPGGMQQIVMALITTPLDSPNGCGGMSYTGIRTVADTAWNDYYNPPPPSTVTLAVASLNASSNITIYPNPAHDLLYIATTGSQNFGTTITVCNTLGQVMNVITETNNYISTINISPLPPGVYYLHYINGRNQKNEKFIKE